MKNNTPEIYNPDHLPDDLKKKIAKLAAKATRQGSVDDVCEDDPIERGLVNTHILNTIGQNVSEPEYDDVEADGQRKLSPKEAEKTGLFTALQTRFEANMFLHKGVGWSNVKASLEADLEALWSLAQMEAKGHEPDVYHDDEQHYYFGTCSKESPESGRNCTYDEAVEMAEAMGIKLMLPEQYKDILQEEGRFDEETWIWLRSTGPALIGFRYGTYINVNLSVGRNQRAFRAWRGSLKVKKVSA